MSCWVRTRRNKTGPSFQVLYRRGGRGYAIETAGTFRTQREAKVRRDVVAGWLAQGLDPRTELRKLQAPPAPRMTYGQAAVAYQKARIDHSESTVKNTRTHLGRLIPLFGDRYPDEITVNDCIEAVAILAEDLKPSTLDRIWTTHRLILDHADAEPNPARDRRVKLPTVVHEEPVPPTGDHFLAMLDKTRKPLRLPLILIEQTGMTVGEVRALEWGDVDAAGSRLRLRRATVKAQIRARARWVQVPDWLMYFLDGLCPLEDRTAGRRVFQGLAEGTLRDGMARACLLAGVTHYHPHDLRHRRITLWHGQGIPARELAARAGHSRPSMSLDTYSHILMDQSEVPSERLIALLV